jgi:peptidoglycan pentaglycine glycine transferase (the first glycine)
MRVTAKEYRVEVDQIDRTTWHRVLPSFRDATIYQTPSYGTGRWGQERLSHLTLLRGEEVVALAQCSIRRTPMLPCGIAYVPWGPVWRNGHSDFEVFRLVVRALRDEYSVRRGLLLRITPPEISTAENSLEAILKEEGYKRRARPYRTLLIDLTCPVSELRKGMSERWRRALKKAESLKLEVSEGTGEDHYRTFKGIYQEMVSRKGFVPSIDVDEFEWIQKDLPESLKMRIMICTQGQRPVAALIGSLIGTTGVGLLGGTATEGLNAGAFQLLNLRMMQWMQESGATNYDFGGYQPEQNSGTASFKAAIPGMDVNHIGQFEACTNSLSRFGIGFAERFRKFTASVKLATRKSARNSIQK